MVYDYLSMHRSQLKYVISTQYLGADRMFEAIDKFNNDEATAIRFVQIATEAPNFNSMFMNFVKRLANSSSNNQVALRSIKIHTPMAGGPVASKNLTPQTQIKYDVMR